MPPPETSVDEFCNGDRVRKFLLLQGVLNIRGGLPEELASTVVTLGDVFAWWQKSRENRPPPNRSELLAAVDGSVTAQSYATQRVQLRPLLPSDMPAFYAAGTDPDRGYRWVFRGATPSLQVFAERLTRASLAQFAVERTDSRVLVGLVDAYDASLADGHAKLSILSVRPSGLGKGTYGEILEGTLLFIDYLFATFDLHKLYAEIPGFNWPQFSSLADELFVVEGVLRAHDYHQGKHWDRVFIALYRERWSEFSDELRPWLCASDRVVGSTT